MLPPKDHPVYKFMDNWTKKSRTRPFMKAYPLMEQMLEEHIEIWNTEAMKKMVMDIMISIGVNLILDDKTQAGDIELIRGCGICIVLLENYESRSDNNSLCPATYRGAAEMRDLNGGSERDIIKFYLKRISCSCLKEVHSEAKKTQSKQGICSYCKQKKDRESLKLCSICKSEHYCGRACQKAHWPEHKQICSATATINSGDNSSWGVHNPSESCIVS